MRKRILNILFVLTIVFSIGFIKISSVKAAGFDVDKTASGVNYTGNSHSAVFKVTYDDKDISGGENNGFCLQPRYENTTNFTSADTTLTSSNDGSYYYDLGNSHYLPLRAIIYYSYNAPGWKKHSSDMTTFYGSHFSGHNTYSTYVYHTVSSVPISYAFTKNSNFPEVRCKYNSGDSYSGGNTSCDWNLYYNNNASKNYVDITVNNWESDIIALYNQMYSWWQTDQTVAIGFEAYYSHAANSQDLVAWKNTTGYITIKKVHNPTESTSRTFRLYKCTTLSNGTCTAYATPAIQEVSTSGTSYFGWDSANSRGTLELGQTYIIWEVGDGDGGALDKNYITSYTNQKTIDGYNVSQVTLTNSSSTYDSTTKYTTVTVTNKRKKGYIDLTKVHDPSETTERTFKLYKCTNLDSNNKCTSYNTRELETVTTNSNGRAYFGWDSNADDGTLDYGTYVIWEVGDGQNTSLNRDYITTYSNQVEIDGYNFAQVTINQNSSEYQGRVKYVTATVTNKKKMAYVRVIKEHVPSESTPRTFKLYECLTLDSNDKCTSYRPGALYTNSTTASNNVAILGYNSQNHEGLLEIGKTYLVWEDGDGDGGTFDDEYETTYTNQVTIGGYNYGQVTVTNTSSENTYSVRYENVGVTNTKEKGTVAVQKDLSSVTVSFPNFRFGYDVCVVNNGSTSNCNTIFTDTNGYASLNTEYTYGTVIRVTERVDSNGYAILYNNTNTSQLSKTSTYYKSYKPVYSGGNNYEEITITNVGTNAVNVAHVTNEIDGGYVEITKSHVPSEEATRSFKLYQCSLMSNGVCTYVGTAIDTTNTKVNGKYYLGKLVNDGTLAIGKTYLVEEVDTGGINDNYIISYDNEVTIRGKKYAQVTVTANSSTDSNSVKYETINITNTKKYGYIEIQKTVTGSSSTFDFDLLHFGYDVCEVINNVEQPCTTVYSGGNSDSGKAYYGQTTLTYGSIYRIKEKVDPTTGHAILYDSSNAQIPTNDPNYVILDPSYTSNNYEEVTITNVGSNGANIAHITNRNQGSPEYGYIKIQKEITGQTLNFSTYHFGYQVCKVVDGIPSQSCGNPVYTDNTGAAYFERTTLELGSVYRIKEIVDSNHHAVIYSDDSGSPMSTDSSDYKALTPIYPTGTDYYEITVTNVGSNPVNIVHSENEEKLGSLIISKEVTGESSFNFSRYHFGFDVCELVNDTETNCMPPIYTDNSGYATVGNGNLVYGTTYRIREHVDNGYAVLYSNSSGSGTISRGDTDYIALVPRNNYVDKTITETGIYTNYAFVRNNVTTIPDYGYLKIEKKIDGNDSFSFNSYHFGFRVCKVEGGMQTCDTPIYTDSNGVAEYGKTTLELNSVYRIYELTESTGYASLYSNEYGRKIQPSDSNYINITPKYSTNAPYEEVTITNVGSNPVNTVEMHNEEAKGYIRVVKTHLPTETTRRHFVAYVCSRMTNGVCTRVGSAVGTEIVETAFEYRIGYNPSTNKGNLDLNKTYLVWEDGAGSSAALTDNYITTYSNQVTINGRNYGVVTLTNSSTQDTDHLRYETVNVTNTKRLGYIEIEKEHIPDEDIQRTFKLYNVGTSGDCTTLGTEVTTGYNPYIDSTVQLTIDKNENVYTIGKIDANSGMLDKDKTYCVREMNVSGELDDYVTTYSPTERETADHIKTAEVTLSSTNINGVYYGTSSVTNTKQYGYLEIDKAIVSNSNIDFSIYHFGFEVCKVVDGVPSQSCGDPVYTDDTGKAIFGQTELELNSVYRVRELTDSTTGYALIYRYSNGTGRIKASNSIYRALKPSYNSGGTYEDVTITNVGINPVNITYVTNTEDYGYIEIQKTVEDQSSFDFSAYHFGYNICKVVNGTTSAACDPLYTDSTGKAVYGQTSLQYGSIYRISEMVDSTTGNAILYVDENGSRTIDPGDGDYKVLRPVYSGSDNYEQIKITNIGTNPVNIVHTTNTESKGYIEINKEMISGQSINFNTYHFGFEVCKVVNNTVQTGCPQVYTNDQGIAKFGLDSNDNSTLDYGTVYRIRELTDNTTNNALLFGTSTGGNPINPGDASYKTIKPSYTGGNNYEEVTIQSVGATPANITHVTNTEEEFGYIEIQKAMGTGQTIDFNNYHFVYEVCRVEGSTVEQNCPQVFTDNNGKAYYYGPSNNNQPELVKGSIYRVREITNSDGYARIFNSNDIEIQEGNTNYKYLKPTTNYVEVTITNVGDNSVNIGNVTNTEEFGYIEIVKTHIPTESTTREFNIYSCASMNNGACVTVGNLLGTTNSQTDGVYYYGKNNNKGTLELGKTYLIWETGDEQGTELRHDYITDYSPSVTISGKKFGVVTLTKNSNSDNNSIKYETINVTNTKRYGYIEIEKEHVPNEDTERTFKLYSAGTSNDCTTLGSEITIGYNPYTQTTIPLTIVKNNNIYTIGKIDNNSGMLDINTTYCIREINVSGELDDYVTTYSPVERETADHIKTAEVTLTETSQYNTYYGTGKVTNTKQFGYINIQKEVQDNNNFDFSSNHFKYDVIDNTSEEKVASICSNDQGIATYGLDSNDNPILNKGKSYTFEEVTDNGYAIVYSDANCTPGETSSNNPYVKPSSQSIIVTVTKLGKEVNDANLGTYSNKNDYCLSVKKTDSIDESEISGVTFELFTDNTCTTTTGIHARTSSSGIVTFNGLSNQDYYVKEINTPSGYSPLTNNCTKVTPSQTSGASTCNLKTISNDALYIAFYKQKEDGTPLTEAKFKVKDSTGKYIEVDGTYNGCYLYKESNTTGSELTVNDTFTGRYCIARIPSGTYTAEEQSTGNDSYWFNNGEITSIIATNTIEPVKGDGSNAIKNNPYVIGFYKVKDNSSAVENASFKVKEHGTNNYIKSNGISSVTGYEGCYIYNGITTNINEASTFNTDSTGRICVIRVQNNKTYDPIEITSGDSAYYVNTNININLTPSKTIPVKSINNIVINYPYYFNFFKVNELNEPMSGTVFNIMNSDNKYIKASNKGTDSDYPDCYIYNGETTNASEATNFVSSSSGEVCVVRTPNNVTYTAIETDSGSDEYYVDPVNNKIANITPKEMPSDKTRTKISDVEALKLVNNPLLINFYKALEDGSITVGGAEFIVSKTVNDQIKYVEVEEQKSSALNKKGCYIYKGLVDSRANASKLISNSDSSNDLSIGEVCVIRMPEGTYKATETKPVEYHTFGQVGSIDLITSKTRSTMNSNNKFINNKTEFKFTKTINDENGYDSIWRNISTEEVKKIPFTIYDSNDTPINVVRTGEGVYEYAGNTIDGVTGTSTTTLYLNSDREFYVYHLPKGTYTVKEAECCCEDTCTSPSSNNCYGFYSPKYSNMAASSYTFIIDDCSTNNSTGVDENNSNMCSSSIASSTLDNSPTEVDFTKADFYGYADSSATVKFENEEEIGAFDQILFKVYYIENGQKVYLNFASVGNIGTCKTDASYSEYRYIPDDIPSSLTTGLTITQNLYSCGGHIHLTHLCRGRKYYIEEISVPSNSVFTLPETEEGRTRELDLECCKDSETEKPTTTTIIDDKPTRVKIEKRDSKYGYLINDETTTFELYRCAENAECHPSDYADVNERKEAGISIVKFSPREVLLLDEEDSNIEVYKAILNDDASDYVTELHPYKGQIILRYLPSGYKYVFLETVSPKNYTLPKGRNRETSFAVETSTVDVEEVDVPNKPTSLLIRKYAEDGSLLEGAEFKIYEGTTCAPNVKAIDQPKTLLTLKTIRDGVYENREIKDTDKIITCTDKEDSKCSDIKSSLNLDRYVDTWTNFDNSINQNNEQVSIQAGEILVQYLDYGHCYIIEEVKAPKGYSLPEKEEDRFVMVTITKDNDVVDTMKELVNKPTPFTFYKYDDYNNLIDGGEFKLQKLNQNQKYEDVTVTEEETDDKLFYKVDNNSTNKTIRTKFGSATVYYLEEGQYRIIETKAPEGMELPKKEINVAVFYVDKNGKTVGNSIITNKPKTERITVTPTASAELIVNISTGNDRIKYGLIVLFMVVTLGLLLAVKTKRDKKKGNNYEK